MSRNVEALRGIIGEVWPDGVFSERLAQHLAKRGCLAVDSLTDEQAAKVAPIWSPDVGRWHWGHRRPTAGRAAPLRHRGAP